MKPLLLQGIENFSMPKKPLKILLLLPVIMRDSKAM